MDVASDMITAGIFTKKIHWKMYLYTYNDNIYSYINMVQS